MTDQYLPTNINAPRGSKTFVAVSPPVGTVDLNLDDDLVVVDTTADILGFNLPEATQIPGWQVNIKALNPGTSGNSVLVAGINGQTIDGAAFVIMTTDNEVLTVKSDGSNWQVLSGSGGAVSSSISLDLTYDVTALASVPPVLFTTWAEILTAVALIPGNPAGFASYVTKYRLNVQDFSGVPAGIYDLNNAQIRDTKDTSISGGAVAIPLAFAGASIENAASLSHITGSSPVFAASPFNWPGVGATPIVELDSCFFVQPLDGPVGPGWVGFPSGGFLTLRGTNTFSAGACEVGGGSTLRIFCYDNTIIASSALVGAGDVDIQILSPGTNINLIQGFLGGTLDLNIGGGGSAGEYTLGESIMFSSGGPVDLSGVAEVELYAGGTNPGGATPPAAYPATPGAGFTLPKFAYLRGIGVMIPTPDVVTPSSFDVTVYDKFGTPVIVESFFSGSAEGFSDATFGRINAGTTPGNMAVSITPSGGGEIGGLADGIVVSVRAA